MVRTKQLVQDLAVELWDGALSIAIFNSHSWTFSLLARPTLMAAELEKAELEAKLARCRALAKEFRSGSTAEMLRDMEEEICLEIRALAKRELPRSGFVA